MSLDALTGAVTGWPLVAVVLAYAVCPYAVLWLAVRLWPKDDDRRRQYLADYDDVEIWMRPLWVGDVAIRCVLDGLSARLRSLAGLTDRAREAWAREATREVPRPVAALAFPAGLLCAAMLISGWEASGLIGSVFLVLGAGITVGYLALVTVTSRPRPIRPDEP